MLGLALSRNAFMLYALIGIVAWGSIVVKKHDTKVARAAVAEHREQSRETVKKAKVAQRRVDPTSARGVLDSKYCTGGC